MPIGLLLVAYLACLHIILKPPIQGRHHQNGLGNSPSVITTFSYGDIFKIKVPSSQLILACVEFT